MLKQKPIQAREKKLLTYMFRVQISGGTSFYFLASEKDVGRPNKIENWMENIQRKIRGLQVRKGERNHHLTFLIHEATYSFLPYGPHVPMLCGTQSSSPKKIMELASPQLCLPIFVWEARYNIPRGPFGPRGFFCIKKRSWCSEKSWKNLFNIHYLKNLSKIWEILEITLHNLHKKFFLKVLAPLILSVGSRAF